ncbi:MAG: PEP-utilizing enzyme [Candidatus Woesearchaeota archaeon]|jgi:phosphoenolpyruvate synthase/pyruvate phosphate dikinase
MKVSPEEYELLFRIESVTSYFCSQLFMYQYSRLGCLVIHENKTWEAYLPKRIMQRCLTEGVELFSSPEKFKEYVKQCDIYQKEGESLLKRYSSFPKVLTESQFKEIADVTKRMWVHKYKNEFYYSDLAYEESKKGRNLILKENLNKLEKIKNEQRQIHTLFFFGNDALLNRVLSKTAQQFKLPKEMVDYLSYENILDLFHGKKIDSEEIKERSVFYALIGEKGVTKSVGEKRLLKFIEFFEEKDSNEIKGVVAYKGEVVGRAIVVPTKIKFTKKSISEIFSKMKKGDILVVNTTSPEITLLCNKASGIVTDQGGMGSHAAIISREFKIPCIVGTKYATQLIKTGEVIKIDGNKGVVEKIK